jgi:PPOX class probable F420-dependent enzyme
MPFTELSESDFLALGTWRKNGKVVDTPVWFASDGNQLLVFSPAGAGKVKRLRNSNKARVAPCTVSGKLLGDWIAVRAEIITDETAMELAYTALRQRYGWKMLVTDFFSKLAGRMSKRVFIRITPEPKRKPRRVSAAKKSKAPKARPRAKAVAPKVKPKVKRSSSSPKPR